MSKKKTLGQFIKHLKKNERHIDSAITDGLKGNRRQALATMGAIGATGLGMMLPGAANAITVGPLSPAARRDQALWIRTEEALRNAQETSLQIQPTNGDEEQYANRIGNYTKGLAHNVADGAVSNPADYTTLVRGLARASQSDLDLVPLAGSRKLVSPLGGWAFEIEGGDGPTFAVPTPPKFNSREQAAEIAENYWMALLRDVNFDQYRNSALAQQAADDLNQFGTDFKGPKNGQGLVTPRLLFRGTLPGDKTGPWLSQFWFHPVPFGANPIDVRIRTPQAGIDFGTNWNDYIQIQNGNIPTPAPAFETEQLYLRNGRGMSEWVHVDVLYQAYLMAMLSLEAMGAPVDAGNPYNSSATQEGFSTFGIGHIATLVAEVTTRALHAAWFQKWFAHRRLRPEAQAGAIHANLNRGANFDIHPEILNSINSASRLGGALPGGNALLPLAFEEGSPMHPAYTAGHATVAGACVTILKAWYDESYVIPNPLRASNNGKKVVPWNGSAQLTVGGELNKIASNVSNSRNIAGVHWRTDSVASLNLGEAVAIQLLREHRATFAEDFNGFNLTKFDGTTVTV